MMKSLLVLFLLIPFYSFGQNSVDSALTDAYSNLSNKDSSDYVIRECNFYLKLNISNSSRERAFYYKGMAYNNLDRKDSALFSFKKVLVCSDEAYNNNYHNESCRAIAKIYIQKKQFDIALTYLDTAAKKYPFHTWGPLENYIYFTWDLNVAYAECYKGKGMPIKAISKLEPFIQGHSLFTSSNNDYMMDNLYQLYLLLYSRDSIKNEFLNAAKIIKVHIKKIKDSSAPQVTATTQVFHRTIEFEDNLNFAYIFTKRPDTVSASYLKNEAIDSFKRLRIYQLATQTIDVKKKDE